MEQQSFAIMCDTTPQHNTWHTNTPSLSRDENDHNDDDDDAAAAFSTSHTAVNNPNNVYQSAIDTDIESSDAMNSIKYDLESPNVARDMHDILMQESQNQTCNIQSSIEDKKESCVSVDYHSKHFIQYITQEVQSIQHLLADRKHLGPGNFNIQGVEKRTNNKKYRSCTPYNGNAINLTRLVINPIYEDQLDQFVLESFERREDQCLTAWVNLLQITECGRYIKFMFYDIGTKIRIETRFLIEEEEEDSLLPPVNTTIATTPHNDQEDIRVNGMSREYSKPLLPLYKIHTSEEEIASQNNSFVRLITSKDRVESKVDTNIDGGIETTVRNFYRIQNQFEQSNYVPTPPHYVYCCNDKGDGYDFLISHGRMNDWSVPDMVRIDVFEDNCETLYYICRVLSTLEHNRVIRAWKFTDLIMEEPFREYREMYHDPTSKPWHSSVIVENDTFGNNHKTTENEIQDGDGDGDGINDNHNINIPDIDFENHDIENIDSGDGGGGGEDMISSSDSALFQSVLFNAIVNDNSNHNNNDNSDNEKNNNDDDNKDTTIQTPRVNTIPFYDNTVNEKYKAKYLPETFVNSEEQQQQQQQQQSSTTLLNDIKGANSNPPVKKQRGRKKKQKLPREDARVSSQRNENTRHIVPCIIQIQVPVQYAWTLQQLLNSKVGLMCHINRQQIGSLKLYELQSSGTGEPIIWHNETWTRRAFEIYEQLRAIVENPQLDYTWTSLTKRYTEPMRSYLNALVLEHYKSESFYLKTPKYFNSPELSHAQRDQLLWINYYLMTGQYKQFHPYYTIILQWYDNLHGWKSHIKNEYNKCKRYNRGSSVNITDVEKLKAFDTQLKSLSSDMDMTLKEIESLLCRNNSEYNDIESIQLNHDQDFQILCKSEFENRTGNVDGDLNIDTPHDYRMRGKNKRYNEHYYGYMPVIGRKLTLLQQNSETRKKEKQPKEKKQPRKKKELRAKKPKSATPKKRGRKKKSDQQTATAHEKGDTDVSGVKSAAPKRRGRKRKLDTGTQDTKPPKPKQQRRVRNTIDDIREKMKSLTARRRNTLDRILKEYDQPDAASMLKFSRKNKLELSITELCALKDPYLQVEIDQLSDEKVKEIFSKEKKTFSSTKSRYMSLCIRDPVSELKKESTQTTTDTSVINDNTVINDVESKSSNDTTTTTTTAKSDTINVLNFLEYNGSGDFDNVKVKMGNNKTNRNRNNNNNNNDGTQTKKKPRARSNNKSRKKASPPPSPIKKKKRIMTPEELQAHRIEMQKGNETVKFVLSTLPDFNKKRKLQRDNNKNNTAVNHNTAISDLNNQQTVEQKV